MIITNKQDLPSVLIKILENDQYTGRGKITATSLIDDPHIFNLTNEHYDDIVTDAMDKIWILLGKGVHAQFEHAGNEFISEQRFFTKIVDKRLSKEYEISAQIDSFSIKEKALTDIKVTSIYNSGTKSDWEEQLNIQHYCMTQNGITPSSLSILKIYRDWHKRYAFEFDKPKFPVEKLIIPLWSTSQQFEFIVKRLMVFENYSGEPCSSKARWAKPDTFAVQKPDSSRARKVFQDRLEAELEVRPNEVIVDRKGGDGRCQEYCDVNLFCPYYIKNYLTNVTIK